MTPLHPDTQRAERRRLKAISDVRLAAELRRCDGQELKRLAHAALTWLDTNHQTVNALNVFPVPDGDTGTNMLLTMQAAYAEIANSSEKHAGRVAHAIAHGALMGARGNSGVILSQIWRGFARALDEWEAFDADRLVTAMQEACSTAYRGVGKPVEGTILTVIKDVAAATVAARTRSENLRALLEEMVTAANASVAHTPELLPVLKQAGVVDAGGKGLAVGLEGMLRYLRGEPLDEPVEKMVAPLSLESVGAAMESIEPGQEWETVVDFRPRGALDLPAFHGRLEGMGTSIQIGEGDGVYRVHIHLLKSRRYEPIDLAEELGTVTNVHMENLIDQMEGQGTAPERLPLAQVKPEQIAVVAVSPGEGLARVMASLGAAAIVSGGQTMNPSTKDFLDALERLPAERVVILPNNKNIILAARMAAQASGKQVVVVPTRTVPQGIAALLQHLPDGDLEAVRSAMEKASGEIESGEVTTATRSVSIDGVSVREGQIIGLHNGALKVAGDDVEDVVRRLLEAMRADERELITLYHGAEVTPGQANQLADALRAAFPAQTFEVHPGGQPYYHYILSAE
jgi:DAK2 domain fusion protein YloV